MPITLSGPQGPSGRCAGPEGEGGCCDSPSLPPLDSLPTRNAQRLASGLKRGSRSGRLLRLEHLTKPKSDQSGSKGEKSQMDISSAFISDEQAPVSMEPGKGSLNNPAVLSKMRGTVHPTSGNAVLYMSHGARLSAKRKIVPFISVKFLRTTSGSPVQISQGRQMIQHIFQHFAIIHIGGSEADNKRNAIAIRYEMMFTSRTTSIYGVGSCVFAPLFAWMTEPSIQALLQSIFFVSCKFCRMTW